MSYQVLARKWRPQVFADVVGQEHVLTALANGLSLGRLHHAYLFSGTRGVGKTTIARLLAKGLNCASGITAIPCGKCENCLEIEHGRFVDLIEIDAASRTRVEDTRELLDNVQYAPVHGRFKVYLIDEVHMLSRHSFNALLKTLEEPPGHVKFLLATTDPQKLPVTILSRCLQFHLKALDTPRIQQHIEHVLTHEHIGFDRRALQMISRAAQGSLRDALSILDQAIAAGNGTVITESVMQMLGALDNQQPLGLIEALVAGDGAQVMQLLQQASERGTDWETLLVEMLRLLHSIAMLQWLPAEVSEEFITHERSLRDLARKISPEDLQLCYQILLTGRKELPFAPELRMGVEMTLLRALAFYPAKTDPPSGAVQGEEKTSVAAAQPITQDVSPVVTETPAGITDSKTSQLLQARTKLLRQGASQPKKREPVASEARPAQSALERLAAVTERSARQAAQSVTPAAVRKESYRWTSQRVNPAPADPVATPKALRSALEHEKSSELSQALATESQARDPWAAEIARLALPKMVRQLALNSWKQQQADRVILHLRSGQRHLNSGSARQALAEALSALSGETVELMIQEDDNPEVLTPLEWRQKIYEEKLVQAKQSVASDSHIQTLLKMFDADLDEESIRPV